jgi:diguanylate cyclase (GGDEF)-like protein
VNQTIKNVPVAIIADDEDLGRLLLAEAAIAAGLTPLVFDNGTAALAAALAHHVVIVLLDVDMPGMNGLAVCERLRKESRFAAVPIVMVTGHEDSDAIRAAFAAGATDFMPKPVNWALLPYRLEYILRNAEQVRALAESESQVRTLVEALPDRLWVVNGKGEVRWTPQPSAVLPQQSAQALEAIRATGKDGRVRTLDFGEQQDDPARTYELRFSRREGGDVVVVRRDTTERTAAARSIERLAYFDQLTALPNRQRCLATAEEFLTAAAALKESVAFIYMDLNGFKRINDAFGHPVGDAVLRIVAEKLSEVIGRFQPKHEHVSIARFGGDEFVILLRHADARDLAVEIADACCTILQDPINYHGLEFHATPSVGVAVYPADGGDVSTVLKHADAAMYHAKSASAHAVVLYRPSMSSRLRDWLDLEARLRRAVREDALVLHFQPKFRLVDDQMVGVEALLRWCDAEYGDIPPSRFVQMAEETGLIMDIGNWVVRSACRQVRAWLDRGLNMPVAINLSGKELLYGDPARVLEFEVKAAGISPSMIEIEITESLLVNNTAAVRNALDRFRNLGCRIALDDFGTGYSCLAYITRFPPDRIKIDKAFVRNVDQSAGDAAIANAILSLGESLSLLVTAEGVERPGQLEWLRRRGCHEAQGFLLSRPLAATELERRLSEPNPGESPGTDGLPSSASQRN